MRKIKQLLFFLLGAVSLGLGVIGMILPILPTTPFILVAAWAFLKSSDRFYRYIMNHPRFGPIVYNYRTHRGLTRRHKRRAVLILWVGILFSILIVDFWPARLMLLGVALGGSYYMLCRLVTLKDTIPEQKG